MEGSPHTFWGRISDFFVFFGEHWREILTDTHIPFLVLSAIFFVGIVICWKISWKYRVHYTYQPYSLKRKKIESVRIFERRWKRVEKRLAQATPDALRVAVIDADKITDDTLKSMRFEGATMADRLAKLSRQDYSSLEGLWKAHQLRNNLAHTPGFTLSLPDAQEAIRLAYAAPYPPKEDLFTDLYAR